MIVEFRAGFANEPQLPLIFLGQLREVTTVRDGADWTTQISSGDGAISAPPSPWPRMWRIVEESTS